MSNTSPTEYHKGERRMKYVKYDLDAELRKFLKNKPTKTTPEVLLFLIASEHLAKAKQEAGAA